MRFHSAACAAVIAAAAISTPSTSAFSVAPMTTSPSLQTSSRPTHRATFLSHPRPQQFGIHTSSLASTLTPLTPPTRTSISPTHASSTALSLKGAGGGPEALSDYILTLEPTSKSSKIQNPKLLKLAATATLPVSYLVGAAITPSRRLAARAVGGVIATVAGGIGKSAVEEDVRKACPAAIARRLMELGVDDANVADGIARLREDYGVDPSDFSDMCTKVYSVYLQGMAKSPITKTADLKELSNLKSALGLSNVLVGQAHFEAAVELYRDITRFTSKEDLEDEEHPDRMTLDKLLFFSERAYHQGGETDEAFIFEFSRTSKAVGAETMEDGLERVEEFAKPFYERALSSARAKLESGAVNPDMLERARATLGLDERVALEMKIEAFAKEIRVLLGLPEEEDFGFDDDDEEEEEGEEGEGGEVKVEDTSGIKFKEGSFERLSKLQELLSLTDEDAEYEILAATQDYFRATALSAMEDAISSTKTPAKAYALIANRQSELLMPDSSMKPLLTSIVMQALGRPLEKTNGFARAGNGAATKDGLEDVMTAKEACQQVLQEAGWSEFEDFYAQCFDPQDPNSACGFLSSGERDNLYKTYFYRLIGTDESGNRIMTDESYKKLDELRPILGLSEEYGKNEIQNFFGPELVKALEGATEEILKGDTTPELMKTLKDKIQDVISNFKLEEELVHQYSRPLYESAVQRISQEAPGGVPSKEDDATLASLRELLDITIEETYEPHLKHFGEAYKKGVKEALGTTGVIREEFRQPLQELRGRLGVSDEAAREIYLEALGERMKPMVEFMSTETERLVLSQDQLAQRRGKDYGEDYFKSGQKASGRLGLGTEGNIMNDMMNLVDFYVENDIVEKKQVGTKKVEKKVQEDGEEKTITEEEPVYESTYPITALGLKCIDEKVAELCYRQFLVGSFTDQGPNAARYEAAKATFGAILGLTTESMEDIGGSIGEMVYDNYISQAMMTKEALDQQDMMFLANIQNKLGIPPEQGEKMVFEAQKKIISEEASRLDFTPETIKAFREKCNKMGFDLESDVGISKARLVTMFETEIAPGIESGEVTMDNADLILEIQESLGLSEEEGEEVIEKIIVERATRLISAINSLILRGMEKESVEFIKNVITYSKFVDGELGLEVDKEQAEKICSVFDKQDFTGIDEEEVEKQKLLLKIAVGLASAEEKESLAES